MKEESKLWLDQAKEHYQDAIYLYQGARYSASVYSCHQALEKILKAAIVEFRNKTPEKIHQLDKLAKIAELQLPGNGRKTWQKSPVISGESAIRTSEDSYILPKIKLNQR